MQLLLPGPVLVWPAAKLAGEAMEQIGQAAVLGELIGGVIIGPGGCVWSTSRPCFMPGPSSEFVFSCGDEQP